MSFQNRTQLCQVFFKELTIVTFGLDERLAGLQGDLAWIVASTGLVFAVAAFAQLPVGELLDRFGARRIMIALLSTQAVLLVWVFLPSYLFWQAWHWSFLPRPVRFPSNTGWPGNLTNPVEDVGKDRAVFRWAANRSSIWALQAAGSGRQLKFVMIKCN